MPFDWREFLALAQEIKSRSALSYSAEASGRTAVSRAYYAAFCHARNYAERHMRFHPTRKGRDHYLLRNHLSSKGDPWDGIAELLNELQLWRNQCDYDDVVPNLDDLVANALPTAEGIIDIIVFKDRL
jgi:uncharacterized protein (UPF0332 family)